MHPEQQQWNAGESPRTRVQNEILKYTGYKLQNPEKVVKYLWEGLGREYEAQIQLKHLRALQMVAAGNF